MLLIVLLLVFLSFGGLPVHAARLRPKSVRLMNEAAVHERAGANDKAIEIYERLIVTDPSVRRVVARELVILYAKVGRRDKALELAGEAMRSVPDPQAYVAGVYTLLKEYKQAASILRNEIKGAKRATRRTVLYLQLAEVLERDGDRAGAEWLLQRAVSIAKGTPLEKRAKDRLKKFRAKRKAPVQGSGPASPP